MAAPYIKRHVVFAKPNPAFAQLRKKIRRSSLLPSEECFPLQSVRRKVRFLADEERREVSDPATQSTDLLSTPLGSPRSPLVLARPASTAPATTTQPSDSTGVKMRDGATSHRHRSHSHGTHAMVNRSDSEKLSEVKLLFKSEAHIQKIPKTERSSLKKSLATKDSASLEEMELFDIRRPSFWRSSHHTVSGNGDEACANGGASAAPSFGGGRRRSTVAPVDDSCDRLALFRLDTLVEGASSREEKEEKILEGLREIVRKCSVSDVTRRPTAHDLLAILNIKSHDLREK